MPVLSSVLRDIDARAEIYYCDLLIAPWVKSSDSRRGGFHSVRRGSLYARVNGEDVLLEKGDTLILPDGAEHRLRSAGEDGEETILLCGHLDFDRNAEHPVVTDLVGTTVILEGEVGETAGLSSIIDTLVAESLNPRPGSDLVVSRLSDVLVVHLFREGLSRCPDRNGFLPAVFDKSIGPALALIHDRPAENWTLESLARETGQSRAAFANRFRDLVGRTMYDYLTMVRINMACRQLRGTSLAVAEVAINAGYESNAAFGRAFRRAIGMTPRQYRKQGVRSTGEQAGGNDPDNREEHANGYSD